MYARGGVVVRTPAELAEGMGTSRTRKYRQKLASECVGECVKERASDLAQYGDVCGRLTAMTRKTTERAFSPVILSSVAYADATDCCAPCIVAET